MSEDTGPNRSTVSVVDAKVTGLRDLIEAQGEAIKGRLDVLAAVPTDVATLKAEHDALAERVDAKASKDEHDALEQRVADIEGHRTLARNWKAMGTVSLMATLLGGVLAHITHL